MHTASLKTKKRVRISEATALCRYIIIIITICYIASPTRPMRRRLPWLVSLENVSWCVQ